MNCVNQSIAQMINNTHGVNVIEICKYLNEDKLNEFLHIIKSEMNHKIIDEISKNNETEHLIQSDYSESDYSEFKDSDNSESNYSESKDSDNIESNYSESKDSDNSESNYSESKDSDNSESNYSESKDSDNIESNYSESFTTSATNIINKKHTKKQKRDIWCGSEWKNISDLENDDVGGVGEEIIDNFCKKSQIVSDIDGTKTKRLGGGIGDGKINGKTCEIKTARLGSSGNSFQHELGEDPWKAEYMIFLDIAPKKMYITVFPNFTEEFYKKSGVDSSNKCSPYFPTKSVTWRKQKGAFKLDTSININEKNNYTFIIDSKTTDYSNFKSFINNIIQ